MIDYLIEDVTALYDTLLPVKAAIGNIALWLLASYLALAFLKGFFDGFQRASDAFWRQTWHGTRIVSRRAWGLSRRAWEVIKRRP